MSASVTLTVSPTSPAHGATVTATYAVIGNDGIPATPDEVATITGKGTVGGQTLTVETTVTLPGKPAVPPLAESFAVPTCPGLTFKATSNPKVFTAVVP